MLRIEAGRILPDKSMVVASACMPMPRRDARRPEVAVRIRTELLGVVVQRGLYASDHPLQVRGVRRMMVDLDRDVSSTELSVLHDAYSAEKKEYSFAMGASVA